MSLPSPSRLDRVALCLASGVLPQADYIGRAGSRGKAIHAYLARVPAVGRKTALAEVPSEYRDDCEAIDIDALPIDISAFAAEVSFAWDYRTRKARELGRDLDRNYDQGETEIAGTADLVGLGDGFVFVPDWKTGRTPLAEWQLKFYALAAARAYGVSAAKVAIVHPDGGRFQIVDYDSCDLDGIDHELSQLVGRVLAAREALLKGEEPPMVLGGHCDYCPAMSRCPAQTKLALALGANPEEAIGARLELTPETAPRIYEKLSAAKRLVAFVEERLQAFATEHPIALEGGRVFGPVESRREYLDGDAAFSVIESLHGAGVARAAVELKATKAGIARALRPIAEESGKTFKSLETEVIEKLRTAGGVRVSVSTSVREHKGE